MPANLTPTVVTDINGRVTTVHKRLDARQGAQNTGKVPAPSIKPHAPASAPSVTPLVMPEPLTEAQLQDFYKWQAPFEESSSYRMEILTVMREPFDGPTQALAWKLVTEGTVPEKTVIQLLMKYHSRRQRQLARMFGHQQEALLKNLRNHLLLAERIGKDHPHLAHELTNGHSWMNEPFLNRVGEGYGYKSKQEDRHPLAAIESEEELASLAAVSAFLLQSRITESIDQYRETQYRNSEGEKVDAIYMSNRSLDKFLRENPHEAQRVLPLVRERGIGNTTKDTKRLLEWMADTEDTTALQDGWL
jgi:hypothetical protein